MGYDAIDNEYFRREAIKAQVSSCKIRKKYNLPEYYFLACARFIEKKNLTRLLKAYSEYVLEIKKYNSENQGERPCKKQIWPLIIMGDGHLRKELELNIQRNGLQEYVQLPGFKQYDELPIYYSMASAFIHPSTSEQWGLVVNEAMASGLPVLVSERCGCAKDLVQNGVNGFVFDPFDIISRLLLEISSMDNDIRQKMGNESLRIIKEWGPERFANGLYEAVRCARQNPAHNISVESRLLNKVLAYI
jgi:glycosyltransferase involved in cell wall biosynthesis